MDQLQTLSTTLQPPLWHTSQLGINSTDGELVLAWYKLSFFEVLHVLLFYAYGSSLVLLKYKDDILGILNLIQSCSSKWRFCGADSLFSKCQSSCLLMILNLNRDLIEICIVQVEYSDFYSTIHCCQWQPWVSFFSRHLTPETLPDHNWYDHCSSIFRYVSLTIWDAYRIATTS